ncbi:tyrosine-type recombinase/integrase [Cellulosilyticum sp. I15G10I2]|uniref:tyrosine-type recombinase/integrase n=1 Tax=Cellulosilyticum sp. I15G10I2 TaxID=1892843 RepID=UPI00085BBBF7|nr:tyrosine-type recombinase/integrase [Cellulosilyticum sp. I15G10I2]
MKINQAINYFMTTLETEQLSEHSLKAYKQDLNQFALSLDKLLLDTLSFEDFHNYFVTISRLKLSTIKRKRVVLHRFLKFCYRNKMCSEKLYEYIDPIKSKKTTTPKDILTKEDILKLFTFLSEQKEAYASKIDQTYYEYLYYCCIRNILIIHILLYTGCRAHEAVAIKKSDIDLLNNTLTLFTKGKKYNQVPIHSKLLNAFTAYDHAIIHLKDPALLIMLESSYLFPSKSDSNTHLSTRTLHDLMNTLSSVLGRHIHAHLFRHTFASYCIAAHMDISTIASLISHSNPSITLSIYTHEIDAHNKQEQIKKLSFS